MSDIYYNKYLKYRRKYIKNKYKTQQGGVRIDVSMIDQDIIHVINMVKGYHRHDKIGIIIAGNAGRIFGKIYNVDRSGRRSLIWGGVYDTVEETILSNAIHASGEQYVLDNIPQWGLVNPYDTRNFMTHQGIDYTRDMLPREKYNRAVHMDACMSDYIRPRPGAPLHNPFEVTLIFTAGPNANNKHSRITSDTTKQQSMAKTFDTRADRDYMYFKPGVETAIIASFELAISRGISIVVLTGISCGIYAGRHLEQINYEFVGIVSEIIQQLEGRIDMVYIVKPKPTCKYAASCYNTDDMHMRTFYHPPGAAAPRKTVCPDGYACMNDTATHVASFIHPHDWTVKQAMHALQYQDHQNQPDALHVPQAPPLHVPHHVPQAPPTYYRKSALMEQSIKTPCRYGINCRRRNPEHFKEYSHPHDQRYV